MKSLLRRPLLVGLTLVTVLATAGGIAWAAIPDGNVVNACFETGTGALRAVDVATDCDAGTEAAVALGGPTRGYSYSRAGDVELGATSVVVASLNLTTGSYLVHGKVNVANLNFTALGTTFVPCSIRVAGTSTSLDQAWVQLMQARTGTGANTMSLSLQAPVTIPAKATVELLCASLPRPLGPTTGVRARFRTLDAIQVDSLQVQ